MCIDNDEIEFKETFLQIEEVTAVCVCVSYSIHMFNEEVIHVGIEKE